MLLLGSSFGLGRAAALYAACFFCLLPIHAEAVCWIVGRAELLATLWVALCLLLSLAYLKSGGGLRALCAAALALAGLLSKENAIAVLPLPALACGLLYPRGERPVRRAVELTICLLITTALYFLLRASAGPVLPAVAGDLLDNPLSALPAVRRQLGGLSILGRYALLTVWPSPLSVDYSYDALGIRQGFSGDVYTIVGGLVVAGFLWALLWFSRRLPSISLALLLAAVAYAPVSNMVVPIGTIMGERLVYLPTLGICIVAGQAAAWASGRWPRAGTAAVYALLVAASLVNYAQASRWQSPVALFESAARAYPRSARTQMELASAYGHAGQSENARRAFSRAVEIKPDYAAAWYNLANFLARSGQYEEAASAYGKALEHAPALAPAWYNLMLVRQLQGRPREALRTLEEAARRAPGDPAIHLRLAEFLAGMGRSADAVTSYGRALETGADEATVRLRRGRLIEQSQGCDAALADYLGVLSVDPANASARRRAVACYRRIGRPADANRLLGGGQLQTGRSADTLRRRD